VCFFGVTDCLYVCLCLCVALKKRASVGRDSATKSKRGHNEDGGSSSKKRAKQVTPEFSSGSESIGSDEDADEVDDADIQLLSTTGEDASDDDDDDDDDDEGSGIGTQTKLASRADSSRDMFEHDSADDADSDGGAGCCVTSDADEESDLASTDSDADTVASDVCADSDPDDTPTPTPTSARRGSASAVGNKVDSALSPVPVKKAKADKPRATPSKRAVKPAAGVAGEGVIVAPAPKKAASGSAGSRGAGINFSDVTAGCVFDVDGMQEACDEFFNSVLSLRDGILSSETWAHVVTIAVLVYVAKQRPFFGELRSAYLATQVSDDAVLRAKHELSLNRV